MNNKIKQDFSNPQGFCYDVESDNFYLEAKEIWMIHIKDLHNPENKLTVYPFRDGKEKCRKQFLSFFEQYENPFIVFHFGLGFDAFITRKFLGLEFTVGPDTLDGKPCVYWDSFYASQYIQPDMNGHGLEPWGERLGLSKIDFHDFSQYSEQMDIYCQRDVDLNIRVFWKEWEQFSAIYDCKESIPEHFRIGQKSHYLMSCQEYTGWKFDIEAATELKPRIEAMMLEIEQDVEPHLPPRKLKKGEEKEYTMPAKPFKKDGTLSATMLKWAEKHNAIITESSVVAYGQEYEIKAGQMLDVKMPMKLGNQEDLKDWFLELGWKPTFWNFKKDEKGKPIRLDNGKLIETTPKIQEAGKICPNLEILQGDLPKKVVKWLSLRNRHSVLSSWLEHPRLKWDGRLPASRTGITPTHRQRHSVLVNLPKASEKVLLGKEFRSLFIANKLVSVDMAALEGRCQAHFTYKYDGGETARELLDGDVHSKNAKAFFPEETKDFDPTAEGFDKEVPDFKPYRDKSKNGYYAVLYGASPTKLASTLGKPAKDGERLYNAFWEANPATASLKDSVEKFWNTKGQKKWLPAIDGRRLITRKKNALLNQIFQAAGAISMDYAICFLDKWLGGIKFDEMGRPHYIYKGFIVKRVGYMHDQTDWECPEEIAEDLKVLIEKSYSTAGRYLKFAVPLIGEGKVGNNLKEVH